MNSSGIQYYNLADSTKSNAFFISTRPDVWNPQYSTSDPVNPGGWGETWTFRVRLNDSDEDTVNVSLWLNYTENADPNFYMEDSKNVAASDTPQWVTFTKSDFTQSQLGVWQYFFNASDGTNSDNTTILTFTVEEDDINLTLSQGNYTIPALNRSTSDTMTLEVRVYDTDRGVALGTAQPGNWKFYVTTDPDDSDSFRVDDSGSSTGQNGYIDIDFPVSDRCYYGIGPQRWRVEFGYDYYIYTNSSDTYGDDFWLNLTTIPLQIKVIGPNNETFRRQIDPINMTGNVTDDCPGLVSGAIVQFHSYPSSDWTYCLSATDNNGIYNCTLKSPDYGELAYYNVTMNATKQYYIPSITKKKADSFVLVTGPKLETYKSPVYSYFESSIIKQKSEEKTEVRSMKIGRAHV